jgi:hypothetical protein
MLEMSRMLEINGQETTKERKRLSLLKSIPAFIPSMRNSVAVAVTQPENS